MSRKFWITPHQMSNTEDILLSFIDSILMEWMMCCRKLFSNFHCILFVAIFVSKLPKYLALIFDARYKLLAILPGTTERHAVSIIIFRPESKVRHTHTHQFMYGGTSVIVRVSCRPYFTHKQISKMNIPISCKFYRSIVLGSISIYFSCQRIDWKFYS